MSFLEAAQDSRSNIARFTIREKAIVFFEDYARVTHETSGAIEFCIINTRGEGKDVFLRSRG